MVEEEPVTFQVQEGDLVSQWLVSESWEGSLGQEGFTPFLGLWVGVVVSTVGESWEGLTSGQCATGGSTRSSGKQRERIERRGLAF